jgi:hypothetical protein
MRPDAIESLRAIQGTLAEALAPELTSIFAQDSVQTLTMLVESLAADWDTAAENLSADNRALRHILSSARDSLSAAGGRNEERDVIVSQIDGVLREAGDGSIAVSSLTAENNRLRAALERLLCLLEDSSGEAAPDIRREAYNHLRQVAVRGWCFWDVASFRERMVRARAEVTG